MAQGYEDLSRRALIKLGKDYDQVSDAALLQYLTDHNGEYEGIRPVEKVIARVDQVKDTISGSSSIIKKTLADEADRVLDTVINTLSEVAETTEELLEG